MALEREGDTQAVSRLQDLRERTVRFAAEAAERAGDAVQESGRRMSYGLRIAGRWLDSLPIPERVRAIARKFGRDGAWRNAIVSSFNRQWLVRLISRSLLARILVSNLFGFLIVFGGIMYLSFDSSWIISAKRDALKTQGQIIAAAIAGNAMVQQGQILVDADRLPTSPDSLVPFRNDGFASLELSIKPERVAPIFRRLTEPTKTRARIYDRRGDLVVDSDDLLKTGEIGLIEAPRERPRTKNFWTRLQHLLIGKEVQVYREIGNANGQLYPEVRRALKGEEAAMLLLNDNSEQIVSVAVPIMRFKQVIGVLLLSTPPGEIDKVVRDSRNDLWPVFGVALLASVATAAFLWRTVAGPMQRLSATAEHLSRDITASTALPDYAERKDEVGQMAQAFSAMTKSLYQRIEASEKFAADVAHELKNPLTAASSMAQSLEYARTEEDRAQVVHQIQQELKRLNRLIGDVSRASLLNAQLQRETPEPVALHRVLSDIVAIFKDKISDGSVAIEFKAEGPESKFEVSGNAGRLGQVFTNLIDNALSFSPEGSTVRITAALEGSDVVVTFDDEGPGIQADKLEAIFSRFYTYRPTEYSSRGNNSGLGLSISKEIIDAHKGRIWAENRYAQGQAPNTEEPVGSRFTVRLPLLAAPSPRGSQLKRKV